MTSDDGNTASEVCFCNKENINNNRSSETSPTATTGCVPMVDKDIEDFTSKQQTLNTKKRTETAVRRLKSWYLQRYGKALNLSTVTKETANSLLTHFFLEIRDTRKGKENAEYEPGTLTTYRNALRRYFLDRPEAEGSRFDIGEDQDLKKKLSSKWKQLKAIGKGNRPNACDALDEE